MRTDALVLAVAESGEDPPNPLVPALYDIVWGTLCFLIILAVFVWRVMPWLKRLEATRIEGIQAKLDKAEADRAEAERLLAQYRQQLSEARAEASRIRTEAQSERVTIVEHARTEAQEAADQVAERQAAQLQAELTAARTQLSREVGTLAISLAERIIGESLADDGRARSTVDRFLDDLESTSAVDGGAAGRRGATVVAGDGDRTGGPA